VHPFSCVINATGFGHYVPDPRLFYVTELSIMISVTWLLQAIKCTTPPQSSDRSSSKTHYAAVVASFIAFALAIVYLFGLLTFIVLAKCGLPVIAAIFSSELGLGKLASFKERILAVSLLVATSFLIIVEGSFCATLLGHAELPYHAFFDFLFFQVTSTFILSVSCRCDAQKKIDGQESGVSTIWIATT